MSGSGGKERCDGSPPPSSAEGASALMGLFAPPPPPPAATTAAPPVPPPPQEQQSSISASSSTYVQRRRQREQQATSAAAVTRNGGGGLTSSSGSSSPPPPHTSNATSSESTPLLQPVMMKDSSLRRLFGGGPPISSDAITPKTGTRKILSEPPAVAAPAAHVRGESNLPSISEIPVKFSDADDDEKRIRLLPKIPAFGNVDGRSVLQKVTSTTISEATKGTTWVGAFMALLFHSVFCLTIGSAIIRPHGHVSMLGLFTKMAAIGIICGATVFWAGLSDDMPALYPTVDLFTAPFLANVAAVIDETLYKDPDVTEEGSDEMFLATFGLLASMALLLSGALLWLASVFKLANLGSFLPSAVLAGFFAAVGVLTWTLAIKVDTNGVTIGQIASSGDWNIIRNALIHHAPSVFVGLSMKILGPKHPFYVVALIFATTAAFYVVMFVFNITLEDMVEKEWFWGRNDLKYDAQGEGIGFSVWNPPVPFGWINLVLEGKVHWGAFRASLDTTLALGFLYMIRCSLHGAALKKNVPNLQRKVRAATTATEPGGSPTKRALPKPVSIGAHRRLFSEAVDIEQMNLPSADVDGTDAGTATKTLITEQAAPTKHSLNEILLLYGLSQFLCALIGSFGITPSVAASNTMYTLKAENLAPQIVCVILLSIFYMTDFQIICYVPKPAFSSLLVLACIDLIWIWFVKSYFKTKEKMEWLVVPLIVVLANWVGLLSAVFLGVAISTFFFVAAFFRSGVVKFMANGISIRSTIERPLSTAQWLDQNGEYIQILVLQNYLFFGNASAIQNYIASMFEDPDEDVDDLLLPPKPKVIILDLALVSGMDSSAVDVISDILSVCSSQSCKLFLSGLSVSIRQTLSFGGLKPETTVDRSARKLRFFPDLDTAVGKAEDLLLNEFCLDDTILPKKNESGFVRALRCIDKQHETSFSETLLELERFTQVIELDSGETLYEEFHIERGISFIEEGILKIERHSDATLSRSGSTNTLSRLGNAGSLNELRARSGTIGRQLAQMKASMPDSTARTFRVARIGPGWVIGSLEALTGQANPGSIVAVTSSRLHHIPFKSLEDIEDKHPLLILKLYKLMSLLLSKRQEVTINHLATLHSIMGSPAQKRAIGRTQLQSLRGSLLGQPI